MKSIRTIKEHIISMSVLLAILGVILFLWPGATLHIVCRIIGIGLLVLAAVGAWFFYKSREDGKASGIHLTGAILAAIAGLIFLVNPGFIIALLPILCGIAIAVNGIANLVQALEIRKLFPGGWTLHLILALATIALGILIFANPFATVNIWVKVLGAILVYDGVSNILTARKLGEN